jgi:hypothetical protein
VTAARGVGGLPPRRPDQQTSQPNVAVQPGSATGILRARIVQVIGGPNSGIFVYSGTPALGNLVASLVGSTTADSFGNTVKPDGLTFYNGTASAFFGLATIGATQEAIISFLAGISLEGAGNSGLVINYAASGTGNAEFLSAGIQGPFTSNGAADDFAEVTLNSANKGNTSRASGVLGYTDTSGTFHDWAFWDNTGFNIVEGSISDATLSSVTGALNGITPGTFAMAFAGATAGAPPSSGAGSGAGFCTPGDPLLSYLTAFASTYNVTAGALNDIVNGLDGWGV